MDPYIILLTCTVRTGSNIQYVDQKNHEERLKTYLHSIQQWIDRTTFKIVVVENSGYSFPELRRLPNRFEIISFQDEIEFPALQSHRSKGLHELYAIDYAMKHSTLLRSDSFLIKITGRYFVPGLDSFLRENRHAVQTSGVLRQHHHGRCEMLGCSLSLVPRVFKPSLEHGDPYDFIEHIYKKRMDALLSSSTDNVDVLQCPEFPIEPTRRGGVRQVYHSL